MLNLQEGRARDVGISATSQARVWVLGAQEEEGPMAGRGGELERTPSPFTRCGYI